MTSLNKSVSTTWEHRPTGGMITLDNLKKVLEEAVEDGVPGRAWVAIVPDSPTGRKVRFSTHE